MIAEILNTGTELLLGNVVNTHLAFLGTQLFEAGFRVSRQIALPDGDAIRIGLEEAFARKPDIVVVTGGLGPTTDDITRELLADMLGVQLTLDEEILKKIEDRVTRLGFRMAERVKRQAYVPEGVQVLANDWGTAPGLYVPGSSQRSHAFFLPGPPRELRPMFTERVIPILRVAFPPAGETVCRVFRIAGFGESMVEERVGEQLLEIPGLELGYCAHYGAVDVRIVGMADVVERGGKIIESAFRESIYGAGNEVLEQVVVRLLSERKQTVATAESCTGGLLASRITNVPGASEVFLDGHITYSNESKSRVLGVDPGVIIKEGAVSEPVAAAMALGARKTSGSDFALSTTGIAGPGGGTETKPVGTVFIGLATPDGVTVTKHFFPTDRETFKTLTTQTALDRLRRALLVTTA